jgi:hypothetical protein
MHDRQKCNAVHRRCYMARDGSLIFAAERRGTRAQQGQRTTLCPPCHCTTGMTCPT